jgi:hypothetical protein
MNLSNLSSQIILGGGDPVPHLTVLANGNVGIGTNDPSTELPGGRVLHIDNRNGASALRLGDRTANGQQWEWQSTVINNVGAMNLSKLTPPLANPLTVLANGNVGIGTTGVTQLTQKLTLGSGNIGLPNGNRGFDGNLYFGGITDAGQNGMRLFGGRVPRITTAGFIDVRTPFGFDGLRIRVDSSNGSTERVRVAANGVYHRVRVVDQSCDIRTKTNIQRLDGALEKLEHVRGVAFVWDESSRARGRGVPGQPSIGVIAQEVEEAFPELVFDSGDEEGYKGVDYSGLTAALIEAAKELKAQNEALRSRIEALERA